MCHTVYYCSYNQLLWEKFLVGKMRQAGVLAAAGIYALDHIAPKLHEDHANAQVLAKGAWI